MAPGQGPLHEAAKRVGQLGTQFHDLHKTTKGWPWPFSGISLLFYFCYEKCYWAAAELERADQRIEGMRVDELRDHPVAWLLLRMGAHPFWAYFYEHNPWGWITQRIHTALPMLRRLETDPWYWIREKIIQRFPAISGFFFAPRTWVWDKVKEKWWWVDELIFHPGRWFLVTQGADIGRAEYYQNAPWAWFIWKFRKEHPPIDAILAHDTYWLWNWIRESIDRYLDHHIDWLISTGTRIINRVWETRI